MTMTLEQFGAQIKAKYPQYASLPDAEVGQKMLAKYPTYQSQVTTAPAQHKDFLNKAEDLVTSIFPGKKIGESLTDAGTNLYNLATGGKQKFMQNLPQNTVNVPSLIGDYASAGATAVAPAAEGVLANAAIGGAIGAGSKVASGETNPLKVLESAGGGAALAGGGAAVGNVIGSALNRLPSRIAQKALAGSDQATAEYALGNTGFGNIKSLLAESNNATASRAGQIQSALSHPNHAGKVVAGADVLKQALGDLPNSQLSPESLQGTLNKLVPNEKGLVGKLFSDEGLTLPEANTLRQKLDEVVKAVYINGQKVDAPAVAATKQVGATVAGAIRSSVKSQAKETVPLFESLQREIRLRNALARTSKKLDKRAAIGLYDILSGIGGFTLGGGPVGAAASFAAEKAARSPAVQLSAAKGIAKTVAGSGTVLKPALKAVKAPLIRALTD